MKRKDKTVFFPDKKHLTRNYYLREEIRNLFVKRVIVKASIPPSIREELVRRFLQWKAGLKWTQVQRKRILTKSDFKLRRHLNLLISRSRIWRNPILVASGKACEIWLKLGLLKDIETFQTLQTWISHKATHYHNLNALPQALSYSFSHLNMDRP